MWRRRAVSISSRTRLCARGTSASPLNPGTCGSMPDRLRRLWDFDDLDASEQRFRRQLEQEPDDSGRAEVLTQLARVEGLRGDFDACERLLIEAEGLAGGSAIAHVRIQREGGRKLRSSGDAAGSLPRFESALEDALPHHLHDLARDAAHM